MKKMNINNPRKLNESEYEELIRLRAEITYIKAENEAIKRDRLERRKGKLRYSRRKSSNHQRTQRKRISVKTLVKGYEYGAFYILF